MSDHADLERAVKLARSAAGKQAALDPLIARVSAWQEQGLNVSIAARVATQAERVAALLGHRGVRVEVDGTPRRDAVRVVTGALARGVIAPTLNRVWVTEEEIFGHRAHRPRERKRAPQALLEDLRALQPGDYVVHVEHGIGKYLGLERKLIGNVGVDLLAVEYLGGKLFLPVYRLNQIQKYSGGDAAPKLDRLGGLSFAKTKAKVERRVRQLADELLRLYAERAALEKEPLPPADDEYAAFEATFPFEETRDQALAISEVAREMESPKIMDRLVCGDVGFGKTEVALRAAFRNALAGRQVALLCPTTVLAQQHYLTFSNRLADYPITVRSLSRFESKKEQTETLKGLKEGSVDVVIGTHRLLSKDVHFKRLGLLVVDEEHRFGVTHKERIKQLRASIDVLTLTATPIPRTLQMAVGGLRDLSIINTPPVDRRAVRTITSRFDEGLIREAVERELARGGQVFYVYNRVEGIYERASLLQQLLPDARVIVGHGQLPESELERTMLDFIAGKYDVLVATAIIESGLDIPRANTMIIDRADLFGLAQLYQLRGRVGRASERAYCYLLVPPPSQLSEEARLRIEALERYTELGSGLHIATLDMELRGAGDLLGSEQSGFVASVGFDLFCQMLEEATHELRGEPVVHEVDPELNFDVEALLPEDYIPEVGVRLSFYKRLASAAGDGEVSELAAEMQDRFGNPPLEARRLIELMRLKTELRTLRVLGCEASAKSVSLHLREDTPLDAERIGQLVSRKNSAYRLSPGGRLTRRALEHEAFGDGLQLADRMLSELASAVKQSASN
jgi:transcription-repair coupling factor (superfamily II helicase)